MTRPKTPAPPATIPETVAEVNVLGPGPDGSFRHLSRGLAAVMALKDREPGDVVPYDELSRLIGVDTTPQVQSAVNAARLRLSTGFLISIESVRGIGYRIVPAPERLRLVRTNQASAQRFLQKGRREAIYVNVSVLTEPQRHALEQAARSMNLQLDYARRLDVRQKGLAAALATVSQQQVRTEAELEEIRRRVKELEDRTNPRDG